MKKFGTCLECGKDILVGEWLCVNGTTNHIVTEKTYHTLDAPTDPGRTPDGMLKPVIRGRTVVCNIPPPKKVMEGDEVKWIGEGSVEFINGIFSTPDPEQQYWLNKNPNCNFSEEQWKNVWLTKEEIFAEKEIALNAKVQRLENERNELLAQTKKDKVLAAR